MSTIKLDPSNHALLPHGYKEVVTEIDFLKVADSDTALLIRGELCTWASRYYAWRGIPVQYVISPMESLMHICPQLSQSQAEKLWGQFGSQLGTNLDGLALGDLLERLFPVSFWNNQPSIKHFAEFLVWIWENSPQNEVRLLIKEQADRWEQVYDGRITLPYSKVCTTEAALNLLDSWLGIQEYGNHEVLPMFPLDIPPQLKDRAVDTWQQEIIQSYGLLFSSLIDRNLPYSLLREAANETARYFFAHPNTLTAEFAKSFLPFLEPELRVQIRQIIPPESPSEFPSQPEDVISWVTHEYLPYREWQTRARNDDADQLVRNFASQFAEWYLNIYPGMLLGGELAKEVSFHKTSALASQKSDRVTLIVLLDGLGLVDAKELMVKIRDRIPRLYCQSENAALSPLPTVTAFCKSALLCGVPPHLSKEVKPIGQIIGGSHSPSKTLRSANLGEIYIWSILEPDETYHKIADISIIRRNVEAQLDGIVKKLSDVVDETPRNVQLQVIITSDHGRLMTVSTRTSPVPHGMESHGRAAWGKTERVYPSSGFIVEGNLVYLHAGHFGLPQEVVMPLGEETFLTSDGKKGTEMYSHGGLYPEEVVIPWLEYKRDAVAPKLEVTVSGTGIAADHGTLILEIMNRSDEIILVDRLEIRIPAQKERILKLNRTIGARDKNTFTFPVNWWPTSKQSSSTSGVIHVTVEGKDSRLRYECTMNLVVEEMMTTDSSDILAGLE